MTKKLLLWLGVGLAHGWTGRTPLFSVTSSSNIAEVDQDFSTFSCIASQKVSPEEAQRVVDENILCEI